MDQYNSCVTKGKLHISDKPLPTRKSNQYVYSLDVSYDQFLACLKNDKLLNSNISIHFNIYDEAIAETREELMLRYQFLKYLNKFRNCSYNFSLSDSTLPAYISFMNSIGWKHEAKTRFKMSIDRNPTRAKEIPLEKAKGKIYIKPDQLQLFSNRTLSLVRKNIEDEFVLEDAVKLKKLVPYVKEVISKNYHYSSLSDFDKAFIIYHYLFDTKNANNIIIKPLSIKYADEQTYYENGVQKLKPSYTRWESRAIGTLEHGKGVCTGQARLFSSLLSNPEINIPAEATYGVIPSGEHHCWVSMVIDNKTYQCCTTLEGLYANLDRCGYVPDDKQVLSTIYQHRSLDDNQKHKIKQHIKRLER